VALDVERAAAARLASWREPPYGACRFVTEQFGATPDPWQEKFLVAFCDPTIQRISVQVGDELSAGQRIGTVALGRAVVIFHEIHDVLHVRLFEFAGPNQAALSDQVDGPLGSASRAEAKNSTFSGCGFRAGQIGRQKMPVVRTAVKNTPS